MIKTCGNCKFSSLSEENKDKIECHSKQSLWKRKTMSKSAHPCEYWESK